jgi:hypothetical protein
MARHPGAEAVATLVRVVVPVDKRGPGSDVLIIGDATGVAIPFGSLFARVLPVPGCLYVLEVSDGRISRASSSCLASYLADGVRTDQSRRRGD